MEMEITLPDTVPVMTLPNVAFFPQALMPLHIFEPRYRRMLRDVLASNRLFAVAGLDARRAAEGGHFEPPHLVAGVGIIRACQKNGNGTSNLLLQGLCRARIEAIEGDEPYRRIRIRALTSDPGAPEEQNTALRSELTRLIAQKMRLDPSSSREMTGFLEKVDDPEAFVDLAAFNLCEDSDLRQKLLETLDVNRRLHLFSAHLRRQISDLKLRKRLQGRLPDDQISLN